MWTRSAGLFRPRTNEHLLPHADDLPGKTPTNRGAGKIQPYEDVVAILRLGSIKKRVWRGRHLDGARVVQCKSQPRALMPRPGASNFDTPVSVCFSKGLGAPVGSALAGTKEANERKSPRRHRKLFGGGMRQVGINRGWSPLCTGE